MRLDAWLRYAEDQLRSAGVPEPKLDAQLLAAHGLMQSRSWVLAHPETEAEGVHDLLARRLSREPLAYIVGYREFFGRRFRVDRSVLVPRQETEVLIETVLDLALPPDALVLDIGTGSGCLGITLALERPGWHVVCADVSGEALSTAMGNAHDLGAEIEFVQGDLFEPVEGRAFDAIVSNPPYIALNEELMPEVVEFEPAEALFSGPTGLEFYERLAREGPTYLRDGGAMAVELGDHSWPDAGTAFRRLGWHVETHKDLGAIERVLLARREPFTE